MIEYLELTSQGGIASIVIIVLMIMGIAGFVVARLRRKPVQDKQVKLPQKVVMPVAEAKEVEEVKHRIALGTGQYKCLAFRPGSITEFTTIPEPIGELYQADTSCPASGGTYIVKQLDTGEVIDYDPREVPVVSGEMPENAWFATHWEIVKDVFSVPLKWWQSTATWFAAAMLLILFISALVTLGG